MEERDVIDMHTVDWFMDIDNCTQSTGTHFNGNKLLANLANG